jgi:excisionase family DNA binding protein
VWPNSEPFFTLKQLAAYLNVSLDHVWRLSKSGKIASTKVGGCLRFSPAAVEKYVVSRTIPAKR